MAENDNTSGRQGVSRRQFITGVGAAGAGLVLGGLLVKGFILPADKAVAYPASQGYLIVDKIKCAGCRTCMLACSLANTGSTNLSLSRIQINPDPFGSFPTDTAMNPCRQCVFPSCVAACPTGACHVDTANGNVRSIDAAKCIGCERCIQACPFTPSRIQWNNQTKTAQKCDLCKSAKNWNEKGGVDGKQACVENCPMKSIAFTGTTPTQSGGNGYEVNLRTMGWAFLGLPIDDAGQIDAVKSGAQAAAGKN